MTPHDPPRSDSRTHRPSRPWLDEVFKEWEEGHRQALLRSPLPPDAGLRLTALARRRAIEKANAAARAGRDEASRLRQQGPDLRR